MKYFIASILFLFTVNLSATKSCALPPCYTDSSGSKFDKDKCSNNSDWIATGEIKIIAHDYQGMPLSKDFLTFIFKTSKWKKGEKYRKEIILFTVGWCKNQFLPAGGDGNVKIYGTVYKYSETEEEYRFLYIERL